MAKVVYDHSGSYRHNSRSNSYRSYSETNSYDGRYDAEKGANYVEEHEEHLIQSSGQPEPESNSAETARLDLGRVGSKSYEARYEPKREYDSEKVHVIQPGRRGPASVENDSVEIARTRVDSEKNQRKAMSYDARYKATNKAYDGGDTVRLLQPGQRGPPSLETDSVHTDLSRIPIGLDIFLDVDQFVIEQEYQSEAWWDTVRFRVTDGRERKIIEVRQEKAENGFVQAVFGKMRQYYMKVYSVKTNECILEFEHPWSCLTPIFCPWASPSMIVKMPTGELLGQVKNASRETCGTCLPPTKYFEVLDYQDNTINVVTGPTCYPFECSRSSIASFELLAEKSGKTFQVGDISHRWRGLCGGMASCCFTEEKEKVTVKFPKESQVEDKALFLSLGFLALFTFFEVN